MKDKLFKNMLHYRPQTKLQEGNVFRGVCLSTNGGGAVHRGDAIHRDGSKKGVLWRGHGMKGCHEGWGVVKEWGHEGVP